MSFKKKKMKSYFFGDLLLPNSAKAYDASSAGLFFGKKRDE
jgi:hypothetical protein